MKTNPFHSSRKTQPLTPEVLVHIAALAESDNGLAVRCARYRRRADVRRISVAACLVVLLAFGVGTIHTQPSRYTDIVKSSPMDNDYICESINSILSRI